MSKDYAEEDGDEGDTVGVGFSPMPSALLQFQR